MKRLNSSETVTLEWVSMNELKIELSLTSEFYIERPLFSDYLLKGLHQGKQWWPGTQQLSVEFK